MMSPNEDLSMESSQQRCWRPVAHCGLTDLFQGSDINSPHPSRSDVDGTCAKMLNFSQQGGVCASQEFGTQDFATPHHGAKPQASQNMSQPVLVPTLAFGAPPTFDGAGKRARALYECGPSQDFSPMKVEFTQRPAELKEGIDLKGCKKIKALTARNVSAILDLTNCSAEEADNLEVASLLRHHAIPAGSPGSYAHRFHEAGMIGSGAFGSVAHVRSYVDGVESAVKATGQEKDLSDADVKRALLEGQLLGRLANSDAKSAALAYYGCWIESMQFKHRTLYRIFTQMELCECSLRNLQVERYKFSEAELVAVINQVASVLKAMHAIDFAHLDVKPANILQTRGHPPTFKLGDLGNSVRVNGGPHQVDEGDRIYLPGELLAGDHSSLFAADVFSLGISMYELSTGNPLPEDGDEYVALRHGDVPYMSGYSTALHGIVKRMMSPDVSERPTAEELSVWQPRSHSMNGSDNSAAASMTETARRKFGSATFKENKKRGPEIGKIAKRAASAAAKPCGATLTLTKMFQ
eukprot:jgi/Ulvmu1/8012/UM004_0248.1